MKTKTATITRAVKGLKDDVGTQITGQAYLSDGGNPPVTIVPGGEAQRLAFYWQPVGSDVRTVSKAILDGSIPFENNSSYKNIEVNLGKKAGDDRLWILGQRTYSDTGGLSLLDQKTNASAYQPAQNLSTLRARPTQPSSMAVQVDGPFAYLVPSTGALGFFTGAQTSAFTAPGAGLHRLALVTLDPETGLLSSVLGSTVTASGTLPNPSEFFTTNFSAILPGYAIPIAYIYLYNGQTTIEEAQIMRNYDPRLVFTNSAPQVVGSVALSSGVATVNTTAVTASSLIFLTPQASGVITGFLKVSAIVAGTSFSIASSVLTDTATIAWQIVVR